MHTAEPQVFTCVCYLPADAQISPQIIQAIAIHLEEFTRHLQGVEGLEWGRWGEFVEEKAGRCFFEIEGVSIMRDDNIRIVEQIP